MQKIEIIRITAIALVVSLAVALWVSNDPNSALGGPQANQFGSATNTSVEVGTATTSILSADSSRQYVAFVNSGSNAMTICFHASTCTWKNGVYLSASGGSYEIMPENLYTGSVIGIATTSTSTLSIISK